MILYKMFPLLCSLMPLEYHPFFDTYGDVVERAYEQASQHGSSGYDGDILPEITCALHDELSRVYQTILHTLSRDFKSLKKELKKQKIPFSNRQIASIAAFRNKEKKRFEKEQKAWQAYEQALTGYLYDCFADGSMRLTAPIALHNSLMDSRIEELKKRYQAIFSSQIQRKHLWGHWTNGNDSWKFARQEDNTFYSHELNKPNWGHYTLKEGRLSLHTKDANSPISTWIGIVEEEGSLFLEQYENGRIESPDEALLEIAELALIQQADRLYRKLAERNQLHLETIASDYTNDPEYRNRLAAFIEQEAKSLSEVYKMWQTWISAAFDNREQLLPSGSSISLRHCPDRNRALYDGIKRLDAVAHYPAPHDEIEIDENIFLGEWKRADHETWRFSIENDVYSYCIFQKDTLLERGTYSFQQGDLQLTPAETARNEKKPTIQLNESDTLLWFKYLFGPLPVKNRFKKISPLA